MSGARSVLTITGFTVMGLFLSLASNIVVAARFGAGDEMDIYLAASALPLFFATIQAGLFNSTFLPVFIECQQTRPGELWKVVCGVLNVCVLASALICLLGMAFAEPIMSALAPGFTPEATARSAGLLRILLPTLVLTAANELICLIFYARKRFVLPSLNKVISPLLTILFVVAFSRRLSTDSLALATLSAAFIQAAIIAVSLARMEGFRYHFEFRHFHPLVIRVLKLMIPLSGAMLVYKSVPLFDRWIGSGLPAGSISVLGYAFRLLGVLQPILLSGIAISFYPVMAEHAARKDFRALKETMGRSIRVLLFASVPISVLLACFGLPLVQALYERGAFDHASTLATYRAFAIYLVALPAAIIGTIISQGYFVAQDTRTPALIGYLETAFYFALCLALIAPLGLFAIPVTYSTYFILSLLASIHLLSRRLGTGLFGTFLPAFGLQCAAALIGVAAAWPLRWLFPENLWSGSAKVALGAMVYFALCRWVFKSSEAAYLLNLVSTRAKSFFRQAEPSNPRGEWPRSG